MAENHRGLQDRQTIPAVPTFEPSVPGRPGPAAPRPFELCSGPELTEQEEV